MNRETGPGAPDLRPLVDIVDRASGELLPMMSTVNPYLLGVSHSDLGDSTTHGATDP